MSSKLYLSGIVVNSRDIYHITQHPQTVTFQLLIKDQSGLIISRQGATQILTPLPGIMVITPRSRPPSNLTPPSNALNLIIPGKVLLNPHKLYDFTIKCTTDTVYEGGIFNFGK